MSSIEFLAKEPRAQRWVSAESIREKIDEIKQIANEKGCDVKDVISVWKIEEQSRQTACYVDNGDNFDVCIESIVDALEKFNAKIDILISILEAK